MSQSDRSGVRYFGAARLVVTGHARDVPYPQPLRALLDRDQVADACRAVQGWPDYKPTPLLSLADQARRLGIGALHYKDEGQRLPLKSFKMLGGGYAVAQALADHVQAATGRRPSGAEL